MKISSEFVEFESLLELRSFATSQNLFGLLKFAESIVDKTGKILVKENIVVKETTLEKLEELSGQYKESFKLALSKDLLNRFRDAITSKVMDRLKNTDNGFLKNIYDGNQHNYKAYIQHSLQNKKLLLAVFKISSDKEAFFNHAADLALLSMGIVIQKFLRVRMLHRFSFLAGLCADLVYANSGVWKTPTSSDKERKQRAAESAAFLAQFNLNQEIIDGIAKHSYTDTLRENVNDRVLDLPETNDNSDSSVFEGILDTQSADEKEEEEENQASESYNDALAGTIIEAMRIARYIDDTVKRNREREFLAEEIVYFLAYNAEKGYFHKDLVNPMIHKFKEFEKMVYRAKKMAEIENMCLHPPSAWVYPKPNASQVVCKNNVLDCPKIVSGWDLHVINQQESFGWIGVPLEPGNYPKCGFESHLEDFLKEIDSSDSKKDS